jgi:hypothetical protein
MLLQNCSSERKHARNAKDMHVKNTDGGKATTTTSIQCDGGDCGSKVPHQQTQQQLLSATTEERFPSCQPKSLSQKVEDPPNKKAPERKKKKPVVPPDSC